jgi:hypothetical protein
MATSNVGPGAVQQEILELEKGYWQAMKDKDVDAAMRMTDFPCVIAGATGVRSVSAADYRKIMSAAKYTINAVEVKDDAQVRMLTNDVAVIAYNVHEELTLDGKPLSLDASDASTWVRRDGRWVCALHTEAITGDPYGRDRVK